MKITYLILISFILFGCTTDKKKNSLTEYNLKGRVKSVTSSEYGVIEKFGEIQKDKLKMKRTYKYDDKGNQIEVSYYSADGSLILKDTYKYYDKGNKIEESHYSADGSLIYKDTYKYDEYDIEGNWIRKIHFTKWGTDVLEPNRIEEREIEYY